MRITTIHYETLVNLGNYENKKVGMSAELEENEDAAAAMGQLIDIVHKQAGKPTRAEAEALKLVEDVDDLWRTVNHHRGTLHRRYERLANLRSEIKELACKKDRTDWESRRLKELRDDLATTKQGLPEVLAAEEGALRKAQARERTAELVVARQLLGREMPELRILPEAPPPAQAEEDDIPFDGPADGGGNEE